MTRHRFDPLSFVFGAVFVAVAAIGLIDRDLLTFTDLRWIAPALLVLLGALLLVLSGRTGGRDRDDGRTSESDADGPAAKTATTPDRDDRAAVDAAVEGDAEER